MSATKIIPVNIVDRMKEHEIEYDYGKFVSDWDIYIRDLQHYKELHIACL